MITPTDYREFALDCLRWADETQDASHSQTLVGLARLWMNTASEMEQHVTLARDEPALFQEMRAKLD